jgi:hypothetical protein
MSTDPLVRLRQAVLVVGELEPVASQLREALDLGEPFRDPGVGEFGLENAVFALGDCFLEVVAPVREGTAAGRYLDRRGGDGGYMTIFDLEDLAGARERASDLGVRAVWEIDLPDIATTHLHPVDMGGAIVSLDRSQPYGSWRWGGPDWTGRRGEPAPGRLCAIAVAVPEPDDVARRWAEVLGVSAQSAPSKPTLVLGGDVEVSFEQADAVDRQGLIEVSVALDRALPDGAVEIGGVRFVQVPPP